MNSQRNRRLALVLAVAGSALLQACASVGTGAFVPTPVKQPAGRFDLMRYNKSGANMLHRAAVAPGPGGVFDYKYY